MNRHSPAATRHPYARPLRSKRFSVLAPGLLSALVLAACFLSGAKNVAAQETRLLRQPTMSADDVVFAYGGDLWIASAAGGDARRLTSTPAVESDPHLSPDGAQIAFTSNRSGTQAVYVVSTDGGPPTRLTWYPASSRARGWTPDGERILYASTRKTAPVSYDRLWTVSASGGPSTMLAAPFASDGSFEAGGNRIVVDRMGRWDDEWRGYRGGQNTPLTILDLNDLSEIRLPNERTTDTEPVWIGGSIYFLSDRNWTVNVWAYDTEGETVEQITTFEGSDIQSLSAAEGRLVFERDGFVYTLDPAGGTAQKLDLNVRGDFPWAEEHWEFVGDRISSASLSPTGKRALMEARGEIFTVPVEHGDPRNLTRTSDAADRAPVWSPDGGQVAWFSDAGGEGYVLCIADQDGLSDPRRVDIGESKMGWETTWSPDGSRIAFVDDDVRVRIVEVESGEVSTADVGGTNLDRGSMGLTWSPDSKWLGYAKTAPNSFGRINVWSVEEDEVHPLTNPMADASRPAWDRDGRHFYFLASTDVALGSGWANTSSMRAEPTFGAYVVVLREDDPAPFPLQSDEEPDTSAAAADEPGDDAAEDDDGADPDSDDEADADEDGEDGDSADVEPVRIDFEDVERRTFALPMPVREYRVMVSGPEGSVFIGESVPQASGLVLRKFTLEDREAQEFARGVWQISVSADGSKMLYRSGPTWRVVGTASPPGDGEGAIDVELRMKLDPAAEWRQIFEETLRYERDYFYDPSLHGRDWDVVRSQYEPLLPHVRHRADLTYVLDQIGGELSVGHSFVGGGDYPAVDTVRVGLLGADLEAEDGRWTIERIYTNEVWNPGLDAPLDQPDLRVEEGHYLVGVDGVELTAADDPYRLLDGTADRQTVLHVNDEPAMDGAWEVTVEPIRSETALRRRAWIEDNRRRVDDLSEGQLAYVWVPNTGGQGLESFNRYYFAQQDKEGAVIDERFNGGGLLDDYMVDLMTRSRRAAITNEVPDGEPMRLPAGIVGPKVLLINELAGSGGDFFPWVFRQQEVGPLIGTRTWGGLVKSSVHYLLVDGGAITAPDNAVFDPAANEWIAENKGVPPDIEVIQDAQSVADGGDPQLERAVEEALRLVEEQNADPITPPPFSTPANGGE